MSNRILLGASAALAVLLLSGSIKISEVNLESMEVGGVTVPGKWKASSPTVQSTEGKYLAYEVAGDSPRVYFTKEKGPHTAWAFVDRKPFTNHSLGHYDRAPGWGLSVDEEGFTLRLRATEGSFRGWFLSRTNKGDLVLTKEAGRAAEVKFLLKRTKSKFK
ncbi:MAG TPA: hypothetical protein VH643_41730 [Gemmataceae bacterium]